MIVLLLSVLPDEQRADVERLFHKHQRLFRRIALDFLHDEYSAEEAVQESMVKVILHIDEISMLSDKETKNYCAMIVRNTAIDIVRKARQYAPQELSEEDLVQEDPVDDMVGLLNIRNVIKEALSHLSREEVSLIYLRYEKELAYREIAALMGINEDAAKKRGARIIKRLRNIIDVGGIY